MPILGQHLSDQQVKKMKDSLAAEIDGNVHLKATFPCTRLWVTRVPYTGDYELRGMTDGARYRIASFGVLPMPGCHKIAILYHAKVEPEFRNKGIGRELLRIRIAAAIQNEYKILLCTCREDNDIEMKLLTSFGFSRTESYHANATGKVSLWRKGLETI